MSRAVESTRESLIKAAIAVFSAKGFEGGSVREITQAAKANRAAINYHFGGKEGLYREVLKASVQAFAELSPLDADRLAAMDGPQAVQTFIRTQLKALNRRDHLGRFMRIFTWETLSPSHVFNDFLATERLPIFEIAELIVRKFLPNGTEPGDLWIAIFWLLSQIDTFIRPERLERPPFNLKLDQQMIDRLGDRLSAMTIAALSTWRADQRHSGSPASQAAPSL
ncbi:MAG: TetR/AcrR family transcriptional regulator, regulator of cefoperazone and chloramphenicol [Methylobacteriaceae bacterium]|jgi:AcrR family transcriptional regulator|nr:TetR/AcrR family transcriptional regulator, regulator of cefoperazone and chloramphenicol [Methylobacteriaceae bacterium]